MSYGKGEWVCVGRVEFVVCDFFLFFVLVLLVVFFGIGKNLEVIMILMKNFVSCGFMMVLMVW